MQINKVALCTGKLLCNIRPSKLLSFSLFSLSIFYLFFSSAHCRRRILSRLLYFFWASGPFVTSFEFGSRTLSLFLLYPVFESFCVSYLFHDYFVFKCYLSLNVMFVFRFVSRCVFRIYSRRMLFYLFYYVS